MGDRIFDRASAAVDVRTFGAIGDGTADDSLAFERAAAAAGPAGIVVPAGTFRLSRDVVFEVPVRLLGTISQPAGRHAVFLRNLDYSSYCAAFGEREALGRALRALFAVAGAASLDLEGRTLVLSRPLDVARAAGTRRSAGRKGVRNGTFAVAPGPAWEPETIRARARFDPTGPAELRDVAPGARIAPGALVSGPGLGRAVHVRDRDVEGRTVGLCLPGWGDAEIARYEFRRYRYALDFSGFDDLPDVALEDVRLDLGGAAGGILLPERHRRFRGIRLVVEAPAGQGLSGLGRGTSGLDLDQCRFEAAGAEAVALASGGASVRLRGCVFDGFETAAILSGRGHLVSGCRFVGGGGGGRSTGLCLTRREPRCQVVGNAFDGCGIRWSDEHESRFDAGRKAGFGGLGLLGNSFEATDAAEHESWLTIRAHRRTQPIRDLAVIGNTFAAIGGRSDRVERVCASGARLDLTRMRRIDWHGNTCRGVLVPAANPVTRQFRLRIPTRIWTLDPGGALPFGAVASEIVAVTAVDLRNAAGDPVGEMPSVEVDALSGRLRARFPLPVSGALRVTIRCDGAA